MPSALGARDFLEVKASTSRGEQVITDGFHKLRAGVSVEPQTNEPSAKK